MQRINLLAAGVVAASFVALSLSPLTRDALRFDAQSSAGRQVLGQALSELGVKQDQLPLGGFGPKISMVSVEPSVNSPEFSVRLAEALHFSGRRKWSALQALVAQFPDEPAAHAALARMACKNGGRVGVGHEEEINALQPASETYRAKPYRDIDERGDAAILLRSCDAGERLEPDNAFFPAMAAIGHYSLGDDDAARDALARAARKSVWREHIDVEADGAVRRAEILYGPQNSLSRSAVLASILFPHYAALRNSARVAVAQAMLAELSGDFETGMSLRRDTAKLGERMRADGSSLICNLVGSAIVRLSQERPAGAPAIETSDNKTAKREQATRFTSYLQARGTPEDVAWWDASRIASERDRKIFRDASARSVFGSQTFLATQWRVMTNLALLDSVTLLCVLAGLALLRPWLGKRLGRASTAVCAGVFLTVLGWQAWHGIGNLRDSMAYVGLVQGLAESDSGTADIAFILRRSFALESALAGVALLSPFALLLLAAALGRRGKRPASRTLSAVCLPLAAVLTLAYAVHLTAFARHEATLKAELDRMVRHEMHYLAAKIGRERR